MHRGMQYGGFLCLPNLIASIFSFKIQFVEMSKPKEDQEINTTPAMPAVAPTKKNGSFRNRRKKVQMAPV